uniref:protein NinF n=1 Tax=Pantoea piersonii TaxID=2364647 RepID=UPI0036F23837
MKETDPLNLHTGVGEPSALLCAGCGTQLLDTEVYACTSCLDLWMLLDPNFRLTGETDD